MSDEPERGMSRAGGIPGVHAGEDVKARRSKLTADPAVAARRADWWFMVALFFGVVWVLANPGVLFAGRLLINEVLMALVVEWVTAVLPLLRGVWWHGYARALTYLREVETSRPVSPEVALQ